MSETPGTYLASPQEPSIQAAARMAVEQLLGKLRIGPNYIPGGAVQITMRININPFFTPGKSNELHIWYALDAEYECRLDGFGPYREKISDVVDSDFIDVPPTIPTQPS